MPELNGDEGQNEGRQSGLPILLVSSDRLFARIARLKLEGWGHTVSIEDDPMSAVRRCQVEPSRLVIVDFDLPAGMGERVARDLRAIPTPHYVYLLAYGSAAGKEAMLAAVEAGADSYAHKPINTGELRLRLDHAGRLLSRDEALSQNSGVDHTGVLSRNAFERFLSVVHAQCVRAGTTAVLMFCEIANIQALASRHGQQGVSAIEDEVAKPLASGLRASDMVARVDTGMFCLLLSNTTAQQCHVVSARIAEHLRGISATVDGKPVLPHLVISMVDVPADAASLQEALVTAARVVVMDIAPPPTDPYSDLPAAI